MIGNGEWCTTLGGRDCSLQMHEQKLLEVSVTRESLIQAAEEADAAGLKDEAAVLRADVVTLDTMEEEASRFGAAVGLDSVSTFECIVDTDSHFFMEMNTRIQVSTASQSSAMHLNSVIPTAAMRFHCQFTG